MIKTALLELRAELQTMSLKDWIENAILATTIVLFPLTVVIGSMLLPEIIVR